MSDDDYRPSAASITEPSTEAAVPFPEDSEVEAEIARTRDEPAQTIDAPSIGSGVVAAIAAAVLFTIWIRPSGSHRRWRRR